MFDVKILNGSIESQRTLENLNANNTNLKSTIDYVAMMAGIDIPKEDEDVQEL